MDCGGLGNSMDLWWKISDGLLVWRNGEGGGIVCGIWKRWVGFASEGISKLIHKISKPIPKISKLIPKNWYQYQLLRAWCWWGGGVGGWRRWHGVVARRWWGGDAAAMVNTKRAEEVARGGCSKTGEGGGGGAGEEVAALVRRWRWRGIRWSELKTGLNGHGEERFVHLRKNGLWACPWG